MKYKLIILIFVLASCSSVNLNKASIDPYSSSGFALIYNDKDFENKIISTKLDESGLEIGHNKIKKNSIIKITNPENNKSIELKVTKKVEYPNFFKIIITKKVSDEIGLNKDLPYVDIEERIKNKSFVAKKAVTHSEEQRVSNRAPITKVKIDNISSNKTPKTVKNKKFTIIVGEFYSKESPENLKDFLEPKYINKGNLKVRKLAKNKFQLFAGPYVTINTLKERYFELNKYGFDDLDIKQND